MTDTTVAIAQVEPSLAPGAPHAETPTVGVPPTNPLLGPAQDEVALEIAKLLPESQGQIGAVAQLLQAGETDRRRLVELGAAANVGAIGNLLSNIAAIRDSRIPKGPSLAVLARSAARSFLKQHDSSLSEAAKERLGRLIDDLSTVADDTEKQIQEEAALNAKGDELEEKLKDGGVYVYKYRHYWRFPTVEGTRRTLLKVGMTTKDAPQRVREQARETNVPEEPLLLRSYRSNSLEPKEAEKLFHRLILAADHESPYKKTGSKEWFENKPGVPRCDCGDAQDGDRRSRRDRPRFVVRGIGQPTSAL